VGNNLQDTEEAIIKTVTEGGENIGFGQWLNETINLLA